VEITLANFIYLIYPKMLLFQHTINTKLIDESFAFFFIQSLCIILHSQHFLVWTSHRPRLNDHVVGGPCHWATKAFMVRTSYVRLGKGPR
jgi:hypothetical protein